jgi:hypothetical protein
MAKIVLRIWYDKDLDLLQVFWDDKPSYYEATNIDWVLADINAEGNLKGFQIEGVTQLEDGLLEVQIPSPEDTPGKAEKPQKSRPRAGQG